MVGRAIGSFALIVVVLIILFLYSVCYLAGKQMTRSVLVALLALIMSCGDLGLETLEVGVQLIEWDAVDVGLPPDNDGFNLWECQMVVRFSVSRDDVTLDYLIRDARNQSQLAFGTIRGQTDVTVSPVVRLGQAVAIDWTITGPVGWEQRSGTIRLEDCHL